MTGFQLLTDEHGRVASTPGQRLARRLLGAEGGFSLVEMMISAGLTMAVVGAAVALSSGVQNVYNVELEDAAVQQEARYALDKITQAIAAAGSDPYGVVTADSCTAEQPGLDIDIDDDGTNEDNAIRILADVNPPNGLLAGEDTCSSAEHGEDITFALDGNSITITDPVRDGGTAIAMTDTVVSDLEFQYLDSNRNVTATPANIRYVQVTLTVQSKARNPYTGDYTTYTYESEVMVRAQ